MESLFVITIGAKAIICMFSMKIVEAKFKILVKPIKCTFSEINTITHHAMSIILHKKN